MFLTRVTILVLIALAIWIGRDPLVRHVLVQAGESAIGAKVDIGQVRTSWMEGKIHLQRVAIADPRSPMTNLFQADSAYLTLDTEQLLHRRLIIEDGTTSQLVFGAPRSVTGRIHETGTGESTPAVSLTAPEIAADPTDARSAWLDRFEFSETGFDETTLNVHQISKQVFAKWQADLKRQVARIESLKSDIRKIYDLVTSNSNQLRNRHQLQTAERNLETLRQEIASIQKLLLELDQKVLVDRRTLVAAKERDRQQLIRNQQLRSLDGELISKLLLNANQAEQIKEVLNWYYSFRDAVPTPESDFVVAPAPGRKVALPGVNDVPSFLVKSLQLDGEGRVAGVKFDFSGTAKNISNEPHLVGQPVTFELRALGHTHVVVQCTLDRSSSIRRDKITIHCPDLPLPAMTLGEEENLQVQVSPCRAQVAIELTCEGERLSGRLKFEHSNLVMQIQNLDARAGGQAVADRINLDLASISDYKVTARVEGSIDNPRIEFESDLGDRLAQKINEVIGQHSQIAESRLDEILNQQLKLLDETVSNDIQNIVMRLENEVIQGEKAVTADLKNRLPQDGFNRRLLR